MRLTSFASSLFFAPALALAQISVVADDACPKYAVDIESFATCDGDHIAAPAPAPHIDVLPMQRVPATKRSDGGLHVTATEAQRLLTTYPGQVVLIDIRSQPEVAFVGQPQAAEIHVPYQTVAVPLQWKADSTGLKMQRNPSFVEDVKAALTQLDWPTDSTILLLCRSGRLSAIAADALLAAGLPRVVTIVDGFEGDMSAAGRRDVNGWKNTVAAWQSQPSARLASAGR